MLHYLKIVEAKSASNLTCIQCAIFKPSIRNSSAFTQKEEPPASPVVPWWALRIQLNPIRPVLDQINLWRYRRIDRQFRPLEFMKMARQRYFDLANAVADSDLNKMKSIMTAEAFDELHNIMIKNRPSEKEAWRLFLKLDPVEHEVKKEKVDSVHFRRISKPFLSAADVSRSDLSTSISGTKTKLFEIYAMFVCRYDEVTRKELVKMGYRGSVVNRADIFWPLVTAHIKFAKIVSPPSSDWLITRAHFAVLFPPGRQIGYMARVAKYRAKQLNRNINEPSGSVSREKVRV